MAGADPARVRRGAIWRGGAKKKMKSERAEDAKIFWASFNKALLVFLLNSALVYVFPRIQNETLKKECIWVRIRGAFHAKKGPPKLSFHREGGGGQLPPFAPPKSATALW